MRQLPSITTRRYFRTVAEVVGAVILLSAGAAAAAAVTAGADKPATPTGLTGTRLHGCANVRTGAVNLVLTARGHCPRGSDSVYWNSDLLGTKTNHAKPGSGGAQCTLGEIILTAGKTSTGATVPASGQLLSIAQNTALFSLLGTEYGGNGTSTFALPDLRGTAPNGLTYSICVGGIFP
jgi:hypothetical protein